MVIKTQDNYCGKIPKAAINFATKKGLPGFFKGLEKAAVQLMVNEGKMTVAEQAQCVYRISSSIYRIAS